MAKINFTTFGNFNTAKNGKEYFEVHAGKVAVDDIFIIPAREAGVYGVGRLKQHYDAAPERVWATVDGLGQIYERDGEQMQRVYINRVEDNT